MDLLIPTLFFCALVLSLSLHEFFHGLVAYILGDDTAKKNGRLTLNPIAHLDPVGTVFLIVLAVYQMGIGWAKPVPINPQLFKDPRRGVALVSFAGPFANFLLAIISYTTLVILQRVGISGEMFAAITFDFLSILLLVNISLFAFNLLPLYPLDGSKIIGAFLPLNWARRMDFYMVSWGAKPLMILLVIEFAFGGIGPLGLWLRLFHTSFHALFSFFPLANSFIST
jgi:Zn-dependent protease